MLPTLQPGQQVLVDLRAYTDRPPLPGDVVLAEHPSERGFLLVKRVHKTSGDGVWLLGDNAEETTDSRAFGEVPFERLRGRVVCRLT